MFKFGRRERELTRVEKLEASRTRIEAIVGNYHRELTEAGISELGSDRIARIGAATFFACASNPFPTDLEDISGSEFRGVSRLIRTGVTNAHKGLLTFVSTLDESGKPEIWRTYRFGGPVNAETYTLPLYSEHDLDALNFYLGEPLTQEFPVAAARLLCVESIAIGEAASKLPQNGGE